MSLLVRALGGLSVERDGSGRDRLITQRTRLALVAVLARAGETGASRDTVVALLWPEKSQDAARNLLRQVLFGLRQDLGPDAVLGGEELRLDSTHVTSDVDQFLSAVERREWERAAALYGGPFLDGFFLPGADEFERWVAAERDRLERVFRSALERLAAAAEGAGDHATAAEWWARLSARDPLSSRVALRLIRTLAAAGDLPAALRQVRVHTTLVREELGCAPDPAISEIERELQATTDAVAKRIETERRRSSAREAAIEDVTARESRAVPAGPRADPGPSVASPRMEPPPVPADDTTKGIREWITLRTAIPTAAVLVVGFIVTAQMVTPDPGTGLTESPVTERTVEVLPFRNLTGDPALDRFGAIAADWIRQGLSQTGLVDVAPLSLDDWSDPVAGGVDAADATRHGVASAVGFAVTGQIAGDASGLVFQASLTGPSGRQIGSLDAIHAAPGREMEAIERAREQVMALLASSFDENLRAWAAKTHQPTSFRAYQAFAQGMEAFTRADYDGALDHYRRASSLDTAFTLPWIWATIASSNAGRQSESDSLLDALVSRRDLLSPFESALVDYLEPLAVWNRYEQGLRPADRMYQAARRLVEMAPASEWLYNLGLAAHRANRAGEAVEVFRQVNPDAGWLRGRFQLNYWWWFALSLHQIGDYEGELEAAREGGRRLGLAAPMHEREAAALAALGRLAELDSLAEMTRTWGPAVEQLFWLRTATELYAHGRDDKAATYAQRGLDVGPRLPAFDPDRERRQFAAGGGMTLYQAQLLTLAGSADSARSVMRFLIDQFPDVPLYRGELGVIAAMSGRGKEAREVLDWYRTNRPSEHYEPARILAALGDREGALAEFGRAMTQDRIAGPAAWHATPAFRELWAWQPFRRLAGPKQ